MKFRIKWKGYDKPTWISWSQAKHLRPLYEYISETADITALGEFLPIKASKAEAAFAVEGGKNITMRRAQQRPDYDKFVEAVSKEMQSMKDREVWKPVHIPFKDIPRSNIVDCLLIMSVVKNPDGSYKKSQVQIMCKK